jgi:hypothetical protein
VLSRVFTQKREKREKTGVETEENEPLFCTKQLPYSRNCFHSLARLVLGKMPVQRINALYKYRAPLQQFGETWFGKRCCLHCLLHGDLLVLDSEWHWIFDCPHFEDIRAERPLLLNTLLSIQENRDAATIIDLCKLLVAIRKDSRIGFSLASFLRQACSVRDGWFEEVCVGGRLPVPPHWSFDIFLDPPCDAEFPENYDESFNNGTPLTADWLNLY